MQAVVMRGGRLVVDEVPEPVPGPGQVLARTVACGICGSDLHALKHSSSMTEMTKEMGSAIAEGLGLTAAGFSAGSDVVMGHEFCAEVLELGPDASGVAVGDLVVSMPVAFDAGGVHAIGYSNVYPGGYGERMVLTAPLTTVVPNGLSSRRAALTEPLAVGIHAVNRAAMADGDAAVVLGTGPIGLAVIAALRDRGVEPIVAADFSPQRRALAARLGAHEVVDPRDEPAVAAWRRVDGRRPLVIFEAVGVPGMLDQAMTDAPLRSQVLVVGVCMEDDRVRPMVGVVKELTVRFALGYDPMEFSAALHAIAEGRVDVDPLITGSVGIDGVAGAFEALADPDAHAKILVEP